MMTSRRLSLTVVLWFIVAGPVPVNAQRIECAFSHVSIESGLPSGVVYSVLQDRQGFMWFSTQVGLCRFDGYSFVQYQHSPTDPNSLSANSTNAIYEQADGTLWIATWGGGLNRFDPKSRRFRSFKRDELRPASLSDNRIQCLFGDRSGRLWIGTFEGGVNMLDLRQVRDNDSLLTFQKFTVQQGTLTHNRIWSIVEDADGWIWVGTDDGLTRIHPDTRDVELLRHSDRDPGSISHNRVYSIRAGRGGFVWVGTMGGLNLWSPSTKRFIRYVHDERDPTSLADNRVRAVFEDREGQVWVGTFDRGLDRLDPSSGRFTHFPHDRRNPYSPADNFIRSIYEDRAGVLWIATGSQGVDKLDLTKSFVHYESEPDNPAGLSHNDVVALLPALTEGDIWVGTYGGGVHLFDRETDRFEVFRHVEGDPFSIPDDRIRVLMYDRQGVLWVGTNNGLCLLDKGSRRFRRLANRPGDVAQSSGNRITALCEDAEGNVWIGSDGAGLVRWLRTSNSFEVYRHIIGDTTSINSHHISFLFCDSRGTVWVGHDNAGLDRWDGTTGFRHYGHDPSDSTSIGSDRITGLCEDRQGGLWIGTNGGGLNRFKPDVGTFERMGATHGFPGHVTFGMVEDKDGVFWIGNDKGVSRYDPVTGQCRYFDISDGLLCRGYNDRAFYPCRTPSGDIFFGSVNGFTIIDPRKIHENRNVPTVVITSFRKFGRDVQMETDISRMDRIDVLYRENFIGFEFVSLDFANPSKNQYAYRLDGFDADWILSGQRRHATYTNLDPGSYVFRVKASNNDGVWNTSGVSIAVEVVPPFWLTGWFRILVIAGLATGVWMYNRYRIRSVRRQNEVLEALVKERTRELEQKRAELEQLNEKKNELLGVAAHDLRSPLNVIIGYLRLIIQDIERGTLDLPETSTDLATTLKAAEHMTALINNILDISAIESGKVVIEPTPESLSILLEECERLYRREALQKEIRLEVDHAASLPPVMMDRSRIAEVMDNLLSNAIKYTYPGGSVSVYCEAAGHEVITHVQDSGQGLGASDLKNVFSSYKKLTPRPTAGEVSTGLGLAIVKKIVDLHGGRVWVRSEQGKGSIFSFSLPTAPSTVPSQ